MRRRPTLRIVIGVHGVGIHGQERKAVLVLFFYFFFFFWGIPLFSLRVAVRILLLL